MALLIQRFLCRFFSFALSFRLFGSRIVASFFNCFPIFLTRSRSLRVCASFVILFDAAYCRIFYESLRFLALCGILILFEHRACWHNLFVSRLPYTEESLRMNIILGQNKNYSLLNSKSMLLPMRSSKISLISTCQPLLAPHDHSIECGTVGYTETENFNLKSDDKFSLDSILQSISETLFSLIVDFT